MNKYGRVLGILFVVCLSISHLHADRPLPFSTVFRGEEIFNRLVQKALKESWRELPIGVRTARVGLELVNTPYVNFTLEIDDRIEAPSVNFYGMDCWTFFETALGVARMLKMKEPPYRPNDLLKTIELDRYRGGNCDGSYLSRLHFLEDWAEDNQKRGLVENITSAIGGVRIPPRTIQEMTVMWKSYRYLKNNPRLLPAMAQVESHVSQIPVYHIPKKHAPMVESKLQNGDIICITTKWEGSYTSHVGLAYRDSKGILRFMHATPTKNKGRKVILDGRLSDYLQENSMQAGFFVVRPKDYPSLLTRAPSKN